MDQVRLSKDSIEVGKIYPVEVIHTTAKGLICKLDDGNTQTETTTFIHISKIANAFVNDISEYAQVGDKFNALGVATDNGNELSLQHLNLKPNKTGTVYEQPAYVKPKTLDDMIEQANSSYRDKSGDRGFIPKSKRRKPFKKPMYD